MSKPKKSRTVLVTGGTHGIGRALVGQLLSGGWNVATFGRESAAVKDLKKVYPRSSLFAESVAAENSEAVRWFVQRAEKKLGPISALVNNAAVLGRVGPITAPEVYLSIDGTISVNLSAPIKLTAMVIAAMRKRKIAGVIVNLTSKAAKGFACFATYSATKSGLNAFTSASADEYASYGIRVFALAPGNTDTRLQKILRAANPKYKLALVAERTSLYENGLLIKTADSANQIRYLLEHPEQFESGSVIPYTDRRLRSF